MNEYNVNLRNIDTDDGQVWLAEYPDIKYCSGSGKTKEEALKSAQENLQFYLEALDAMGEPYPQVKKSNYSGKFTVRLSKSLHEALVREAENQGISLNAFVAEALSERIGRSTLNNGIENVNKNITEGFDKQSELIEEKSREILAVGVATMCVDLKAGKYNGKY